MESKSRLNHAASHLLLFLLLVCDGDHFCTGELSNNSTSSKPHCFKALFQFGASLFDTGNAAIAFPQQAFQPTRQPYGSTFPGRPARRFSDGKLIIDHLADAFKVPLIRPYLDSIETTVEKGSNTTSTVKTKIKDYRNGVCFSVALATALSVSDLLVTGIGRPNMTLNPLTLDVQYHWFKTFRKRAFAGSPTKPTKSAILRPNPKVFATALYLPGEFGVNDYRVGLLSGLTVSRLKHRVPSVVRKIVKLIKKLHGFGARNFLVIGVPPQGCSPFYLTLLKGPKDEFNCLSDINEIHQLHQSHLKTALQALRTSLPDSDIIFADYYGAYMSVIRHPAKYGMHVTSVACCGGGGPYNYNPQAVCGTPLSKRCSNPENHVFWDDFHSTDAFNNIIANKFLSGEFLDPSHAKLGCPLDI
eukprot:Gb_41803 [translate_table: standard]